MAGGESLTRVLPALAGARTPPQLRGALADLSYTTLRAYGVPQLLTRALLDRPLTDAVLSGLLYVALVDLRGAPERAYVVVDQAVRAAERLGRAPAKGLVNAILRNYLRRRDALERRIAADRVCAYCLPRWWLDALEHDHPGHWQAIAATGNEHPPLTLRVNRRRIAREDYLRTLAERAIEAWPCGTDGVRLAAPVPVERIPGFALGQVSVQDLGAQLAADYLDLRDGLRVLDACAAPGGKTGHILERANVRLVALDNDRERLARIEQNLERLALRAQVVAGDAATPKGWWDERSFDRILADVPCSASGVVRRHPDIKWLRRREDTARFAHAQAPLLDALWQVLAPGGRLLFATCSVFGAENQAQALAFAERHRDARPVPLAGDAADAAAGQPQRQLLPGPDHDGFFYAAFEKN